MEVASFAVDYEAQIPTASKALLDNCTSLLASKLMTAESVGQFARKATKDGMAPTAIKLLARLDSCDQDLSLEVVEEREGMEENQPCFEKFVEAYKGVCNVLTGLDNYDEGLKVVEGGKEMRESPSSWKKFVEDCKGERSMESVKLQEKTEVCPNCKVLRNRCLGGQEVRFIQPQQVFIFN